MNRLSSQVPGNWWYILLAMEPPQMADLLKPKIHQTRYCVASYNNISVVGETS